MNDQKSIEDMRIRGCDIRIDGVWHATVKPVTYPAIYGPACGHPDSLAGVHLPSDGRLGCGHCVVRLQGLEVLPEKEALARAANTTMTILGSLNRERPAQTPHRGTGSSPTASDSKHGNRKAPARLIDRAPWSHKKT